MAVMLPTTMLLDKTQLLLDKSHTICYNIAWKTTSYVLVPFFTAHQQNVSCSCRGLIVRQKGMWGLVGGRTKYTESAFEGLKREIKEEVGAIPKFKKVIPFRDVHIE